MHDMIVHTLIKALTKLFLHLLEVFQILISTWDAYSSSSEVKFMYFALAADNRKE